MNTHLLQCIEAGAIIFIFGVALGKAFKKLGE